MVTAFALNCSLKPSPADSSTDLLLDQCIEALKVEGIGATKVRVVDFHVLPGVQADMGDGDEWPQLRNEVLEADILLVGTPTWLGQMSSVAQRVLERLDAELSETDDQGRPVLAGKVAAVCVVGNEDGAHKITADLYQALTDVGFSVPSQAATYWNGEAMHKVDYKDLASVPAQVASATATLARNTAHLAKVLNERPYPPGQDT